ncbi:hypothetical protein RRG08_012354 [Elysia crispata]|uniref:Uncharacterized protein n=1 Tax=Elysia crispata TaxID=231223 RepID=A0AAE1DWH4_9GAST|nr:hypothetical protein RRG08_012354 [Elysia crispata]
MALRAGVCGPDDKQWHLELVSADLTTNNGTQSWCLRTRRQTMAPRAGVCGPDDKQWHSELVSADQTTNNGTQSWCLRT